ncbi:uncharacterized protein EDB91DRAFT_1249494 [Suillus paluster]|uniref:uncharacterized protein n=1 Tax=Suillus paluster TaxID=48578 RepID=UPI001B872F57|nr:uncharacterized protein EDB91DRAFT_1249494 [Suillus paluster]KAG1737817.1 hypothetical protein EDB91DRAFT_1249494 [Suillus paluster]
MEKEHESRDSDEEMTDDGEDEEDTEEEDTEEEDTEEEDSKEEDAMEGSDDKDEDEDSGSGDEDGDGEEYLIDNGIADEMDEFGYTSLDQVLVEDEDNDGLLDDDALGAKDGEELEGGLNYDEAEGIRFADL